MSKQLPVETLLKRRVRRGARFLDQAEPTWYRKVDPAILDLADSGSCVMGQLQDGYLAGLRHYDVSTLKVLVLGFDADYWLTASGFEQYSLLTEFWIEEIRARNKN